MTLRDLLRKKQDIEKRSKIQEEQKSTTPVIKEEATKQEHVVEANPIPEFTFMRTTTHDQEVIQPPVFPSDEELPQKPEHSQEKDESPEKQRKRRSLFRRSSAEPHSRNDSPSTPPKLQRTLSRRLSALRHRSGSRDSVSSIVPESLTSAPEPVAAPASPMVLRHKVSNRSLASNNSDTERARERAWEERATALAKLGGSSNITHVVHEHPPRSPSQLAEDEATLQRAITLHESGELDSSTALFGELARPSAANHPLAQVLYGLALRHGWGIDVDQPAALHFFSLAASGAAGAGGTAGPAKAELILALYEMGNCYRHGWGTGVDARAARAYYDAAANLGAGGAAGSADAGDPDALEDAAWCWLTGFGGEKDKRRAAGYLRRAEQLGRRQVGNSWIWKEKYDPPPIG